MKNRIDEVMTQFNVKDIVDRKTRENLDRATRNTIEDLGTDSAKEYYRNGHCPDDLDPENNLALCDDFDITDSLCDECRKNSKQKRP